MPNLPAATSQQTADFSALRNQSCAICLEPLNNSSSGQQNNFPILRTHATQNNGLASTRAARGLPTIPEGRVLSPSAQDIRLENREHLFHIECYANQVAHNGTRQRAPEKDWDVRCPLCQKQCKLSEATPYHNNAATSPTNNELKAFKQTLFKLVENNARTIPGAGRSNNGSNANETTALLPRRAFGGRHPYPIYVGGHPFVSAYRPLHGHSHTEPLRPLEQQAAGGVLVGLSIAALIIHAPLGFAIMAGVLGSATFSVGTVRQCTEGSTQSTASQPSETENLDRN